MSATAAAASTALALEDNKIPADDGVPSVSIDPVEDAKGDDLDAPCSDLSLRRPSPTGSMDDMYLHQVLQDGASDNEPSRHSRGGHCRSTSAHRVRITYHDEKLRERCERNVHELLQAAFNEASADSTSTILARKALRYRRILQRMEEAQVDVHDPAFNTSACLGVEWHHAESA